MDLTIRVHEEDDRYWAEVAEIPGCFASGASLDELREALEEAISLCLDDEGVNGMPRPLRIGELRAAV
jgi:predicted RNase H-like HicB family nuclease